MELQVEEDGQKRKCSNGLGINEEYLLARRPTYLKVFLDTILDNLRIVRSRIAQHTDIIAVVKGNAYGHGSIPVSRFLQKHGVSHFAVATALEGEDLRQAGIDGFILVLGNAAVEEIPTLYENDLTPTVSTVQFLNQWSDYIRNKGDSKTGRGTVVIKIDTGMSRNGCSPEILPDLVKICEENSLVIHSIMTHFAQSWDDLDFTEQQLQTFLNTVRPYRDKGIKFHVANSGAIANGVGLDLDFVRPGISMYGQPPDTTKRHTSLSVSLGYRPAICWIVRPNLVKQLQPGDVIGYDQTYKCRNKETIGTFPVGYADGYHRNMFEKGFLTTPKGIQCQVVGRISMDSITVRLPDDVKDFSTFYLLTSDTNPINSSIAIARIGKTIPYEVCTDLHRRVPRLYETDGKVVRDIHL